MKKIGILTYHRVFNFGSLLQTYALQNYLERKNCDVEVIDYYPSRLRKKELLFHINPKWRRPIFKLIVHLIPAVATRLLGYHMMNTFLNKYIKLTSQQYETIDDLIKNIPKEDIYLNGSDQIWNVETANGEVDRVLFMDFLDNDSIRAAYAGSFGKDDFSDESLKEIKKYLDKYSAISVREKSGVSILEKIGIKESRWVLDPTFLLRTTDWDKIAGKINLPNKYLLVYNLNRNPRISQIAMKIATRKNLKIVNMAQSLTFVKGAKNILYPTPNTFITMFKNAEYVVTDSFHGTAFSINFEKQFVCIPAPRFNARLESILELINESDRLLLTDDISIVDREINYNIVSSIIEEERKIADKFIDKIVGL